MSPLLDWMVLARVQGLGVRGACQLVRHFGTPAAVLSASVSQIRACLGRKIDGLGEQDVLRERCKRELEELRGSGIVLICPDDTPYPSLLKEIADPPLLLYAKGDVALLSRPCLGVVGSRAASSYGERVACDMARQLAGYGMTVVSGLALGIDGAAHKGALGQPGSTIGVLGCGLDVIYPQQNKTLFQEIEKRGLLLSEYPLKTPPEGYRFPARNRIIAGLSLGVLVVEAAKKSGSLITAEYALDEGRDVYAIPGRIDSAKSEGTHSLLQQGAKLVHTVHDILEDISRGVLSVEDDLLPKEQNDMHLSDAEQRVLAALDSYPLAKDSVMVQTGLDISLFNETLLLLELDGIVEILPGGFIKKNL